MHTEVAASASQPPIVASRNNETRTRLETLDVEVARLVKQAGRAESSLKAVTADLIVAGVQMGELMEADPEAWDAFVKPFGVRVKGRDRQYRQIAEVLFRKRSGQRTVVRSQKCRVGAAICVAHQWFAKVNDLDKLRGDIVAAGCVEGLANRRREQLQRERDRNTTPAAKPRQFAEISVPIPTRPLAIVLLPDGSTKAVPPDVAKLVFDQLGIAQ